MTVPASYLAAHRTERLRISPITDAHTPHWVRFLQDERATRFFPEERKANPDEMARTWTGWQHTRYANDRFGLLALHLEDGTYVGQCGLLLQEIDEEPLLEIGYHLFPEYWGNGYATEAATYFREYARAYRIAPFVVSIIHIANTPSQAVAQRNGMELWKQTKWHDLDVAVYRIHL